MYSILKNLKAKFQKRIKSQNSSSKKAPNIKLKMFPLKFDARDFFDACDLMLVI
jgi:hypothetical protein